MSRARLSESLILQKIDLIIEYGNLHSKYIYKDECGTKEIAEDKARMEDILTKLECKPIEVLRVSDCLRRMLSKVEMHSQTETVS